MVRHAVPGNHYSLVREPQVEVLGQALGALLEAAEREEAESLPGSPLDRGREPWELVSV
jgi:hypothetical protein